MLDFWTLSAGENTENKLRVYVLLWEIARECSHPQVCERVHLNRNGLTGNNTHANEAIFHTPPGGDVSTPYDVSRDFFDDNF